MEVLSTRSEASVIWQDGSVEEGISSKELYPILHLDDQEFFCGDFVSRNTGPLGNGPIDTQLYGIVQSVDHFSRTCKVKWFKTYSNNSATV